jgi:hypothetical protein
MPYRKPNTNNQFRAFGRDRALPATTAFETAKLLTNVRRTAMKFRPLHDRVVIERIDPEAKTAGGIIIPDTAQEKPQQGKVQRAASKAGKNIGSIILHPFERRPAAGPRDEVEQKGILRCLPRK